MDLKDSYGRKCNISEEFLAMDLSTSVITAQMMVR